MTHTSISPYSPTYHTCTHHTYVTLTYSSAYSISHIHRNIPNSHKYTSKNQPANHTGTYSNSWVAHKYSFKYCTHISTVRHKQSYTRTTCCICSHILFSHTTHTHKQQIHTLHSPTHHTHTPPPDTHTALTHPPPVQSGLHANWLADRGGRGGGVRKTSRFPLQNSSDWI